VGTGENRGGGGFTGFYMTMELETRYFAAEEGGGQAKVAISMARAGAIRCQIFKSDLHALGLSSSSHWKIGQKHQRYKSIRPSWNVPHHVAPPVPEI